MKTTEVMNVSADPAKRKPVVLVLLGHYLPGYKAGGPIRSIANMVEALGDELEFRIVTCDRDMGEKAPYDLADIRQWLRVGKAEVLYVPDTWKGLWTLVRTLICTPADLLYLNSFFARRYSMLAMFLRRLWLFRPKSVLLAPRGEFSVGALKIRGWKKRSYIAFARRAGLYGNVLWHASSHLEEGDIHKAFCDRESIAVAWPISTQIAETGHRLRILTALDMPGASSVRQESQKPAKGAGTIRLLFLSRVCRKKNLDGAIRMLRGLRGEVQLDVYGPIEDRAYWETCQDLMSQLPQNIDVRYRGEAHHELVHQVLCEHDALLFPTHGENYGHVIREALSAGCPVIISDQTPWRGLEALGVGWDMPLKDSEKFRAVIQKCIDMSPEVFAEWARRAFDYGYTHSSDPAIIEQNRRLFAGAVGRETFLKPAPVGCGQ